MKIELSCAGCGGNRFALADAGRDDAAVACEDCGQAVGTLGELKESVAAQVLGKTRSPRRR